MIGHGVVDFPRQLDEAGICPGSLGDKIGIHWQAVSSYTSARPEKVNMVALMLFVKGLVYYGKYLLKGNADFPADQRQLIR
jgi:hypothetical protein